MGQGRARKAGGVVVGCNQDCDQGRRCDCAPAYQTQLPQRILRWLIHFDIWVMRTFLGGRERETISAAAWNAHLTGRFFGWTHHIIDLLFRITGEKQHCKQAWLWQKGIYK